MIIIKLEICCIVSMRWFEWITFIDYKTRQNLGVFFCSSSITKQESL